ncbi:MAG: beta family protein [Candidatus Margulisbacteria bacterium]|jgi:hypothetical protein|nr:beta family protein [Candidatus Margulisiibacteriota bacterium]
MSKYYYFPILKTRPSEVNAYDILDSSVKDGVLPIIEMTGELGYTYSQKHKDINLRGKRRPGDINKKIQKILDFMGQRKFILDITDDNLLKYDGLSDRSGGLLDPTNGYETWRNFLLQNPDFKNQVIPTIQFNTIHRDNVEKQIIELDKTFNYIALKLPTSIPFNFSNEVNPISQIIDWIFQLIKKPKLFLILDFDYLKAPDITQIQGKLTGIDITKLKALIPVFSSFPSSVSSIGQPPITIYENDISDWVQQSLKINVYHGDYSSIHPTRYETGGAGWLARIDYIVRDKHTKRPLSYNYFRAIGKDNRNKSSSYYGLAKEVIVASDYVPVNEILTSGDQRIKAKANGGIEGKAPSYWITVRSNIYMTMQYIYLKKRGSFLVL